MISCGENHRAILKLAYDTSVWCYACSIPVIRLHFHCCWTRRYISVLSHITVYFLVCETCYLNQTFVLAKLSSSNLEVSLALPSFTSRISRLYCNTNMEADQEYQQQKLSISFFSSLPFPEIVDNVREWRSQLLLFMHLYVTNLPKSLLYYKKHTTRRFSMFALLHISGAKFDKL